VHRTITNFRQGIADRRARILRPFRDLVTAGGGKSVEISLQLLAVILEVCRRLPSKTVEPVHLCVAREYTSGLRDERDVVATLLRHEVAGIGNDMRKVHRLHHRNASNAQPLPSEQRILRDDEQVKALTESVVPDRAVQVIGPDLHRLRFIEALQGPTNMCSHRSTSTTSSGPSAAIESQSVSGNTPLSS